jgi:Domain of unknown function (DUF5050)
MLLAVIASRGKIRIRGMEMTKTICRAEKRNFAKTIMAFFAVCAWAASSHAQTASDRQGLAEQPAAARGHVYWTNSGNGSVGRATTAGTRVSEKFIVLNTTGGAGLTVNKSYIYWTSANGGTATTIARANLNGTGVNQSFITGAQNPCGVAVDSSYIYWAGDVGTSIGRAKLDGSGVNQDFITTGNGVCGVAVTGTHIYWANYETGDIGRAKLDGSDVNDDFISGCGSGIAIEGKYIYFTTTSGTGIGRANIDGTDVNTSFMTGLNGEIAFLAADSNYIFWADWGSAGSGTTIGRANLDGTQPNQSFIKGTKGGFGIAVTGGDP